jgi:uncharacterized protein (TIGR02265 family)
VPPDFTATLDAEAEIAAVPPEATSKGTWLSTLADRVTSAGQVPVVAGPFIGFKDYPGADFCRLLVQAARVVHRDVPLREGLRRIGRAAYNDINTSLVGRVVFGAVGRDIHRLMALTSKAYEVSGHPQRGEVVEHASNHAIIRLTCIFTFVDCYQPGVLEGVLDVCGLKGTITMKKHSASAADFLAEWA